MKIGIIGLGAISPYFLAAIERDNTLDLAAVCDRDESKMAPFAARGIAGYRRYTDLLREGGCEAVIVTLPNDTHAEVVVAALDAGISVCCEKPLAITSEEAERITEAAGRSSGVLLTAFHRRYNSNLRRLKERLPDDPAQIAEVVVRYHENITEHTQGERWYLDVDRCGGGCVIDNGPNALDAARYLVGDLSVADVSLGDVRRGAEFCAELDLVSAQGVLVRVELDWALPTGEVKDVTVYLADGRVERADMLAGYDGFKASLHHEYDGIVADFRAAIGRGAQHSDSGADLVRLVAECYRLGRAKHTRLRMPSKLPVSTRVVRLLFHVADDRGMRLSPSGSRCIPVGQIHELVTTTDRPTNAGDIVDNVGFLGFVEFKDPAMLCRGDEVWLGDLRIGTLAGFDESHFPNHYNILIRSDRLWTAGDVDLRPLDEIRFVEGPQEEIGPPIEAPQ